MTIAKSAKKRLSSSADEQDQQRLTQSNDLLDNGKVASFRDVIKLVLPQLFTRDNADAPTADDMTGLSTVDNPQDGTSLNTVEDRLQTLIAAQNALATALAEQQAAATDQHELTAAQEAEHFAAIETTLAAMQTAQQALQNAMQQQGETITTELQTFS